jgi:hypothetical protein
MDKVIKEFNNESLDYKLGYNLYEDKVYPRIEIYKDNKLLSSGHLSIGIDTTEFYFNANYSSSFTNGYVKTIKEMFIKLREAVDVPEKIEREYESLFIMYKLNNYKENVI